jgi:hypothetical protein
MSEKKSAKEILPFWKRFFRDPLEVFRSIDGVPSNSVWSQLGLELWLGFIAAAIWTPFYVYYTYVSKNDGNIWFYSIQAFFSAFFFFSVFTGHYIRVNKQLKTDYNFSKAENKLEKLSDQLEKQTNNLLNHLTGGDSFCFFEVYDLRGDFVFYAEPRLAGKYNLYGVSVVFVNVNESMQAVQKDISELTQVNAGKFAFDFKLPIPDDKMIKFVFATFYARNGVWNQQIDFMRDGHVIRIGTTVRKQEFSMLDDEKNVLYRSEEYTLPIPPPPKTGPGSAGSIE